MSKIVFLLFIVCFSLIINSCKKGVDEQPPAPIFQAEINGKMWKASSIAVKLNKDNFAGYFTFKAASNDTTIFLGNNEGKESSFFFKTSVVTLTSFTALRNRTTGNKINLSWTTRNETNSDKFELQRSFDGVNFSGIIDVPAAGNSTTEKTYQYIDKPPKASETVSRVYYRLKMVDLNTSFVYSPTLVVSLVSPGIIQLSALSTDYAYGFDGNVTIAKMDTVRRTIDGSFNFSYYNDRTGQTEQVSKGVFKNVIYQ
jgi:hypothetical protein